GLESRVGEGLDGDPVRVGARGGGAVGAVRSGMVVGATAAAVVDAGVAVDSEPPDWPPVWPPPPVSLLPQAVPRARAETKATAASREKPVEEVMPDTTSGGGRWVQWKSRERGVSVARARGSRRSVTTLTAPSARSSRPRTT